MTTGLQEGRQRPLRPGQALRRTKAAAEGFRQQGSAGLSSEHLNPQICVQIPTNFCSPGPGAKGLLTQVTREPLIPPHPAQSLLRIFLTKPLAPVASLSHISVLETSRRDFKGSVGSQAALAGGLLSSRRLRRPWPPGKEAHILPVKMSALLRRIWGLVLGWHSA